MVKTPKDAIVQEYLIGVPIYIHTSTAQYWVGSRYWVPTLGMKPTLMA